MASMSLRTFSGRRTWMSKRRSPSNTVPASGRPCGGQRLLHIPHVQAQAGGLFAVDLHREHGQAGGLLDLDLGGAGDLLQHAAIFGVLVQDRHVVAEDFDRHIAAHARDQLVEAQLDGLGELVVAAGLLLGLCLDGSQQVLAAASGSASPGAA
jgi:hypothetical protein